MDITKQQGKYALQFLVIVILNIVFALYMPNGEAKPALTDYGQLPTIQNMAISPSGERLAYRKTDDKGDVIIIYSNKDNQVVGGVDVTKNRPRDLYFISENELILVVSDFDRISGFVGEYEISAAYVFKIKENRLQMLLPPGDLVYSGQTNLGRIIGISPDGERVYMPAYSGKQISSTAKAMRKYSLLEVRLNKIKRPGYHAHGSPDTNDYLLGKDGEALVEERYNNATDEHTILVNDKGEWREIYKQNEKILTMQILGMSSDFKSIVVLKYNAQTGRKAHFLMSLKDGALTESGWSRVDADIDHVILDVNRVVYGVAYAGFNLSYKFYDPKIDQRMQHIMAQFPDHTVWLESWSKDWTSLLVYVEGPSSPGDYFLFPEGNAPSFIATARPNITPEDINPIAQLTYTARDGLSIPTILTIPQQHIANMKNLPAVILPHGGPASYDKIAFDWLSQAIANQGYLVVQPQFRGSDGFGIEFKEAGYGQWGKKMQDDLTDSVAFLKKKGIINADKVCIVGASYGGYAALAGAAFTPELYQCSISLNGVSNLNRMLSSSEFYFGSNHSILSYWELLIASEQVDENSLKAISPVNFAKSVTAPVLLIHSENDRVVLPRQSDEMYSALKSNDKVVKYVTIEDDNHYLQRSKGRIKALKEIVQFLDSHIGNAH